MIHPARQVDYQTLVDALDSEYRTGNVAKSIDGPLTLYKYTQQCVFEKRWNVWNSMARGLIVDTVARKVISTPFPKFFNWPGEHVETLPDEPFEVTTKIDGSLGIIFLVFVRKLPPGQTMRMRERKR